MNPLVAMIPQSWVRYFARPYVAGDSLAAAIETAVELQNQRGLLATLDLLGEKIRTGEAAARNVETYCEIIDAVAAEKRFWTGDKAPTVSMKPSGFCIGLPNTSEHRNILRDALFTICGRAKERGLRVTVDMEGSEWTDFTLEVMRDLHKSGHHHVGTVLQSRLLRTVQDVEALPPACRVRLVIGIYSEHRSIALTDKDKMKERLLTLAGTLLRRGHYVEMATHDERYVRGFLDNVVPWVGAAPDRYEIQMLYGVPRNRLQDELVERRVPTRLYVPFALNWPQAIAYLRRRLDEYPAMAFMVLGNLGQGRLG